MKNNTQGVKVSKDILDKPNGIYDGYRAGYLIKLDDGTEIKTITGIRCTWNFPFRVKVKIVNGIPYLL